MLTITPALHHEEYYCVGGPYHGETLGLSGPSTGPICIAGWTGQYVGVCTLTDRTRVYAEKVCRTWLEKEHPYSCEEFEAYEAPFVFWKETP